MRLFSRQSAFACSIVAALMPALLHADGIVIDKIYHPYIDALERELEYRSIIQDAQPNLETPAQAHQLSVGTAIGNQVFAELYLIGEKSRQGSFSLEAWEAELKWQITEQGEYAVDWGLLVEYEDERSRDAREFTVGLLAEKEWGRWSGTANLHLIREWGQDINSEFETVLALQARYRYSRLFEPALEFYAGQNTRGLGPVVQGTFNTGIRKAVHWEAGVILGLDAKSADQTWRLLLEYEF